MDKLTTHQPACADVPEASVPGHERAEDALYSLTRWRRLRRWYLTRNPLCADPWGVHAAAEREESATDVHHVQPLKDHPELAMDPGNLQALCRSCHSRLTRQEGGTGARPPTPSPTVAGQHDSARPAMVVGHQGGA